MRNTPAIKMDAALRTQPTFLGIGAMRAGSTWLYEVLKSHPDVQMTDPKEVQFFFLPRMLQCDLNWYEQLFQPENGHQLKPVRGEISPQYARLKNWQVKKIAELMPDLRLILILRHPIERLWSQTLFDFGRLQGRDIRRVGAREILRQLERARSRLSSDYVRTIKIWSDAFGKKALHIAFFDRLRDDPQTYVNGVLKHLGATTPWHVPPKFLSEKVWSTSSLVKHDRQIPEVVEWYMADLLLKPTEGLNQLLEGQVSGWVDELRAIRGNPKLSWRVLKALNRAFFSAPERVAYAGYHVALDARLWQRWRQLKRSYEVGGKQAAKGYAASLA